MKNMKEVAIVTGASSGLGLEFVKEFLKEYCLDEIWVVARNKKALSEAASLDPKRIKVFALDLTKEADREEIFASLEKKKPNVRYLVNAAGVGYFGSAVEIPADKMMEMVNLNVIALTELTRRIIPFMKRDATLFNISSIASFIPLPYFSAYAATKAYVQSFTRALKVELLPLGISVTTVCPGWVSTPFLKKAVIGSEHTASVFDGEADAASVVKKAIRDAKKGRDVSIYGKTARMYFLLSKILPTHVMMRFWMLQQHF